MKDTEGEEQGLSVLITLVLLFLFYFLMMIKYQTNKKANPLNLHLTTEIDFFLKDFTERQNHCMVG